MLLCHQIFSELSRGTGWLFKPRLWYIAGKGFIYEARALPRKNVGLDVLKRSKEDTRLQLSMLHPRSDGRVSRYPGSASVLLGKLGLVKPPVKGRLSTHSHLATLQDRYGTEDILVVFLVAMAKKLGKSS